MDLLAIASSLVEVMLHHRSDPFAESDDERTSLAELVDSFIEHSYAETTAVLTAIRLLVSDELLAARIGRELSRRPQPMPAWLTELTYARPEGDVWVTSHVLGDGDSYLIGVTMPSGRALTALVYIDHNLGTLVKDAFVVTEPLAAVAETMAAHASDPDQTVTLADPASVRALTEEAIERGAMTYPPLESETWPMCRPLVEWMLRLLPTGGSVPERPHWPEARIAALADDFFASPFGVGLDDRDRRGLLENVLWFGTDYGPGDPLRWSEVSVEILLLDWVPRKIVADSAYLAQLPQLLRAFIRYAHHQRGIRRRLTSETVAAVDRFEPEYQRLIRSERPQGPAALIAQALLARAGQDGIDLADLDLDDLDLDEIAAGGLGWAAGLDPTRNMVDIMLRSLDDQVGGREALQAVDAEPLPDEPFAWDGIADDVRPVVEHVLTSCDACADELLDIEHRTAMRRFLRRAAVAHPELFRRKASPVRGAAAVAWAICRANETAGDHDSPLTVQELLAWFGVRGSVSQRAEPMLRAIGVEPQPGYGPLKLGSPDLLVSGRRAAIIGQRDRLLAE
jgi:hypothetical protein